MVTVNIESIENPTHQLANGSCCSDLTTTSNCASPCNEMMRICLRPGQQPPLMDTTTCTILEDFSNQTLTTEPRSLLSPPVVGAWPVVCQKLALYPDPLDLQKKSLGTRLVRKELKDEGDSHFAIPSLYIGNRCADGNNSLS